MNIYSVISKAYDILDKTYFAEKGQNPRAVIEGLIPNEPIAVLDLCCGTLANTFPIAKAYPRVKVTGIDLSQEMLDVARKKCRQAHLQNVSLRCEDATCIPADAETFDRIIIGLMLHECAPELREKILKEAFRVLKPEGRLIVLEWEPQTSLIRKIKYAPLYLTECMGCRSFDAFYKCDKERFFKCFGFRTRCQTSCNYSTVIELEKISDYHEENGHV